MPYNIIIDHTTTDRGDQSSRSSFDDDGESSGDTGVHLSNSHSPRSPRSAADSHELNEEGSWVVYHDDIGPSDSASRPQTSNHERPIVEAPQPEEAASRPTYRRRITHERIRNAPHSRARRTPPSAGPESVDSHEDWQGYAPGPPNRYVRQYAQYTPGYPPAHYQAYPQQSLVPMGQQQVVPFGFAPYQGATGIPTPNYFGQAHHAAGHVITSPSGAPFSPPPGYYSYAQQSFPIPQQVPPLATYTPYPQLYSPPPVHTPPPSSDTSNKDDEKFARLEKLLIDQKEEQAAKEAAAEKAAKEQAAQAEADARKATEIKVASDAAAAAAKEEAEREHRVAAEKAAADKEAADKEAAAKEAAAQALAAATQPPKEKDKPIKFKDAVGRKFSFPFHLCSTWSGMEYLIKEAFVHVAGIGPHVAEGHYDLLGPQGEIILPHVWETVIEPDWSITMHMWPMTEEKEEEPAAENMADIVAVEEGVPPPPPPAPSAPGEVAGNGKGKTKKPQRPPGFMFWTAGKKTKKGAKTKKK